MKFSGLELLSELKDVQIKGFDDGTLKKDVEGQLSRHQKKPVLTTELVLLSSDVSPVEV